MKKTGTLIALVMGLMVGAILNFTNLLDFIHFDFNTPTVKKKLPSMVNGLTFLQSEAARKFDIDASKYFVHHNEIQKNEFLSDILLGCNVPYPIIDKSARKATDVFPVTKLRVGKPYTVLCDSTQRAAFFIYEPNPIDYVVFDLRDSIQVYAAARPVETRIQTTSGTIHSSLSVAMERGLTDPQLSLDLSEIFAWTIDFFRIQKGDQYKVIYEQKYVDGEPVGIGKIHAAYFKYWGSDNYAFAFNQSDEGIEEDLQYFDEQGQSVRRAFLKAPLKYSRISSKFTHKRFHPVLKRYKSHLGTDYAAATGTPILAVGAGTVTDRAYGRGNGRFVKIRHNSVYTTQYLHMSKFASGVNVGTRVRQGQVIGYVGSTGLATGPHLCFRFWKNGQQVNPLTEKMPPAHPVKPELADDYCVYKDSIKLVLDAIEFPLEENDGFLEEVEDDLEEENDSTAMEETSML
ncbi:MAG: peptidoglycan DD-metalloendopeptidase family protein [Chitinophagales bacterium]